VKPNPEHFETLLKMLGSHPESTVIVGDSGVDMQSAKELKTIAVGIPTGVATVEQLTNQGANYIITSIADLPVLIEKINKGYEAKQ
jgi:pyrophosphatase PpaX